MAGSRIEENKVSLVHEDFRVFLVSDLPGDPDDSG